MSEKNFVKNQTVWVLNPWGSIDECQVLETPQWNADYYKLQVKNGGWYTQSQKNIFATLREAVTEKYARSKEKRDNFKSKINNLKDLFDFMISQMSGHETSDIEAILASKERIFELTGIDIDEE